MGLYQSKCLVNNEITTHSLKYTLWLFKCFLLYFYSPSIKPSKSYIYNLCFVFLMNESYNSEKKKFKNTPLKPVPFGFLLNPFYMPYCDGYYGPANESPEQ